MGEVYRATDSVLERPVAVKVLAERYAQEPDVRARFEREALAAARLSREWNVVTVFDVGEHRGRPLIVMEYVDGGSVHDRLAKGPVPREQALDWLEQVATALDRAHASGIVHRDVKPANLLLDSEGNVRVSDFGIASAAGLDSLTLPGTVLGTAGYLSPEQARGEPATPASDRYSLGVIAFELLTGRRPFGGDTAATEAYAHVSAPVPSATEIAPDLPQQVDRVLARALAKDPADRPASCAELVSELRRAFAAAEPVVPVLEPATVALPTQAGSAPRSTRVLHHARTGALGTLASAGSPAVASSRRLFEASRRRPRSAAVAGALALLLVAVLLTALLGAGGDGRPEGSQARPPGDRGSAQETGEEAVDGVELNARGYELMQTGRFREALPLLREAVLALKWTGTLDEAYASYNLAFTRFALGRCDGVVGLLDRSERIQGEREAIDDLRSGWEDRCAPADDDGDRGPPDDGKGKGKGKGKGRGGD